MATGIIYKITAPNGHAYVGETIRTMAKRWSDHCCAKSCCTYLKHAINKYGRENMTVEIIEENVPFEKLIEREAHYILEMRTLVPNGYNIRIGTGRKASIEDGDVKSLGYTKKPPSKCADCGVNVSRSSTRCLSCEKAHRSQKHLEKLPPVEEIIEDVEKLGFQATGRKHDVDGNSIRKWLETYEKYDEGAAVVVKEFRTRWKNTPLSEKLKRVKNAKK
tara:strand:- start:182 stop:838 length:657 start_codon:yes stop_codon:yes gene_type:complete